MYSRGELFLRSLECYLDDYFPRCFATREINTKITLSWALKQFVARAHTSSSIYLNFKQGVAMMSILSSFAAPNMFGAASDDKGWIMPILVFQQIENNIWVTENKNDFRHDWGDSPITFTRDAVMAGNHWRITSRVTNTRYLRQPMYYFVSYMLFWC